MLRVDWDLIQNGWDPLYFLPIFGFLVPGMAACAIVFAASAIASRRRSPLAAGMFVSGMIGVVGLGAVNVLTACILVPDEWWSRIIFGGAMMGAPLALTSYFIKYRMPAFTRDVAATWVKRGATFITALLLVSSFYLFSEGSRTPHDLSERGSGTISIRFGNPVHVGHVEAEFGDILSSSYVDLNFGRVPGESSGSTEPVFIELWNSTGPDSPFGGPTEGGSCMVSVDHVPSVCAVKHSSITGGVVQEIRIDQPLGDLGVRVNIPGRWSSRGSRSQRFSLPMVDLGSDRWPEFQRLASPRVDDIHVDYSFNSQIEPYPLPQSGVSSSMIRSDQRLESVTPQTDGPEVLSWTARNPGQTGAPRIPAPTGEIVDSAAEAAIARETFVLGALIGTSSSIWSSLNVLGMKWAASFPTDTEEEAARSTRQLAKTRWHHSRSFHVGKRQRVRAGPRM